MIKFLAFSPGKTHIHKYCVVSGLIGPLEASRYSRLKTSSDFLSLTLFKTSPLAAGSPSASPVVPPLHLMHLYPAHVNSLRLPQHSLCFLQQARPSIHFSVSNATHTLNLTSSATSSLAIVCFFKTLQEITFSYIFLLWQFVFMFGALHTFHLMFMCGSCLPCGLCANSLL